MHQENVSREESRIEATVVQVTGRGAIVETDGGEEWTCAVRGVLHHREAGNESPVVVGDRVRVSVQPKSGPRIEEVLPRRNVLQRRTFRGRQVVAANLDQVVVTVAMADPPLRTSLIDRYLVAAHQHGIEPIVCLNKTDLAAPEETRSVREMYARIGYVVVAASALTGEGIDELAGVLRDRVSVMAGPSGAGKSTLLNRLHPRAAVPTASVNPRTGKGRHTTSSARMFELPGGGFLIDTPGVRDFLLWDMDPDNVARFFPEFVERAGQCRYPDCTHVHEEPCAVRAAVATGEIDPRRYEGYLTMLGRIAEEDRGGGTQRKPS